jgi:hypothetical protein
MKLIKYYFYLVAFLVSIVICTVAFCTPASASFLDNHHDAAHVCAGMACTAGAQQFWGLFTDRVEQGYERLPNGEVRFYYKITETHTGFTIKSGLAVATTAGVAILARQDGRDWDLVMSGAGLWSLCCIGQRALKVWLFK